MRLRDETDALVVVRSKGEVIVYMDEDNTFRCPIKVWRKLNDEVEKKYTGKLTADHRRRLYR